MRRSSAENDLFMRNPGAPLRADYPNRYSGSTIVSRDRLHHDRRDRRRYNSRCERLAVPIAGIEGAAGFEDGCSRGGAGSAGDRSGGSQGFRAFLPDHGLRVARIVGTARRGLAFPATQANLTPANILGPAESDAEVIPLPATTNALAARRSGRGCSRARPQAAPPSSASKSAGNSDDRQRRRSPRNRRTDLRNRPATRAASTSP